MWRTCVGTDVPCFRLSTHGDDKLSFCLQLTILRPPPILLAGSSDWLQSNVPPNVDISKKVKLHSCAQGLSMLRLLRLLWGPSALADFAPRQLVWRWLHSIRFLTFPNHLLVVRRFLTMHNTLSCTLACLPALLPFAVAISLVTACSRHVLQPCICIVLRFI